MTPTVTFSADCRTATVCTGRHTTKVDSPKAANAWLRFYKALSQRKNGVFYIDRVVAWKDVVARIVA